MLKLFHNFAILTIILLLAACASTQFQHKQKPPRDDNNIPQPAYRSINNYGEYFEKQVTEQLDQAFDLSRNFRIITGNRKEAYNTDSFDEVFNSTWFTNRHHLQRLSKEELIGGPDQGSGPDTSGTWTIISAKNEGVTPGFAIEDASGNRYLIKFDPQGYSELASGAEVVSTKLFYAMGYNTPENYIVRFDRSMLKLGESVKFTDSDGKNRLMRDSDLDEIFQRIEFLPNGRIRALASKFLQGTPLGPFRYKSTRKDDPNDFIAHHHRRELRGLRIISAWLNHFDTKDGNTLDMFVTENGRSFVRHYLIDFGATLGSASWGPNHIWRGHQYEVDPAKITANLFTLGLAVDNWQKREHDIKFPSIGYYTADIFDPMSYKGQVPNPAFENMTVRDGFWAARLVTAFTDEDLRAIITQGQYSDPAAAEYLLQILKERRDKIGRYFFRKLAPLDNFRLVASDDLKQALVFTDLAVEAGYHSAGQRKYRYQIVFPGVKPDAPLSVGGATSVKLPTTRLDQLKNDQYITVKLHVEGISDGSVEVYLKKDPVSKKFAIAGIRRKA